MSLCLALLSAGCATVFPPQTASTVEPGRYRVGASVAYAQWCGVGTDPLGGCNLAPRGLSLPEVRLSARHGLSDGVDLGASAHLAGVLERGVEGGLYLDLKRELWRLQLENGRRNVLSLAPGLGYTSVALTPTYGGARIAVLELGLPLYFGLQRQTVEWVFGLRYLERLSFQNEDAVTGRDLSAAGEVGGSVGVVKRQSPHWGVEVSYQSRVDRPLGGLFLVSLGASFDLGGDLATEE